jgi:fermentation-respiration switch protein FrsA (DUF1100 family)
VEPLTADGLRLRAWYTPPQNGAVVLVAHGYAAARSSGMHAFFALYGFGALSWDARAHGMSEGEISTFGYTEVKDVEAALNFARSQPAVQHVGAWGGSMGAATVVYAAAQLPGIEAVVADSALPAIDEMIGKVSLLPGMAPFIQLFAEQQTGLSASQLRPIDHIAAIRPRPVFLILGMDDRTVPPDSAQRLYAAAHDPKELWVETGVGHVAMFDTHRDEYTRRVIEFFTHYLASSPESSPPPLAPQSFDQFLETVRRIRFSGTHSAEAPTTNRDLRPHTFPG